MTRTAHWLYGWLLLLPAVALLALFTHYPAVATLWHSFYSTPKGARPAVFVGLDNYRQLVDDPIFWQALTNNLWYALGTIPLSIALALLMAVWVNGKHRRARLPAPRVLHADGAADDRGGQHLALLLHAASTGCSSRSRGAFGLPAHNWLGSKSTALGCLMVVTVWKEAGFFMIFYLAALQPMSPHLAEAAAIEGASRWYFFRRVTFPLLMPTTLFVLVNAVINAFRLVDHIVVMTRGGPDNATALLLYYIYEIGFRFWDSAYAAALTMVLLALLGARRARAVLRSSSARIALPMSVDERTDERRDARYAEPRGVRRARSKRVGAWLLGAAVGAAARLRVLDGVPSGRVLDALRR